MTVIADPNTFIEGDVLGVIAKTPFNTPVAYWNDQNGVGIPDNSMATINQWHTVNIYAQNPGLPGGIVAIDLRGELLTTHGSTAATSDMRIWYRKTGEDEPGGYFSHSVLGLVGEGNRSLAATWVPVDEFGQFDIMWDKTGPAGSYPTYSIYGFSLHINAYLRDTENVSEQPEAPELPPHWSLVHDPVLTGDGGGFQGYTVVVKAGQPHSQGGSKVRVSFRPTIASGGNTVISNCWIGHPAGSGDSYDFDGSQVRLTFSAANGTTLTQGGAGIQSDEAAFTIDPDKELLIAMDIGASGGIRYGSDANFRVFARASSTEAGTTNKTTGYTDFGAVAYTVDKIEFFA